MRYEVREASTAAILGGAFNPRIFEPSWFSRSGLIAEPEVEDAEVQQIDRQFCHLNFGWVDLVVTADQFSAETTSATVSDLQLRDLVVGVLRLLPHTPLIYGSIHHRVHVLLDSPDTANRIGDALAPKEAWSGFLDNPGLFDFAMQGDRPDDLRGAVKVRIQPSADLGPRGIFINVNDEFYFPEDGESSEGESADLFEGLWPEAEDRAQMMQKTLFDAVLS